MKKMRSHILKRCILLLLMMGFMSTLAEPVDAARSHVEFSHWLQLLAKKAPSADVRQQLDDLKKSKAGIDRLIMQASHIVNRHNEAFNLPSRAGLSDIQHVLLMEWNQHCKSNSTMGMVPSFENAKTLAPSCQKAGTGSFKTPAASHVRHLRYAEDRLLKKVTFHASCTLPMIDGAAIGAP